MNLFTDALKNLLKLLLYFLVFSTPLIFVNNTNELYEFPKMFFVYFLGATVVFILCILALLSKVKIKLPSFPVLFYLSAAIISTIFSSHLYTSVWGYYTRFNGGLISIMVFIGIYLVISSALEKSEISKILLLLIINSIPISIYGISQHFEGITRVYTTIGQPNWAAAYIAMIIPLTLFNYLRTSGRNNFLFGIIYLLEFACLWFTYSVSGFLGFVGAIFALFIINRKEFMSKRTLVKAVPLVVLSILIAALNLGVFKQRVEDILTDVRKIAFVSVYALENVPAVGNNLSDPGFIRSGLWEGTLKLAVSSPKVFFVGTGLETYPYAFQPFRPKVLNYSSEWDFIFNKPHNYYLEILSTVGVLGLTAYGLLMYKSLKTKHLFLVPSLVSLYISNVFGWPTVATALVFWIYMAIFDAELEKGK